jgi:hypothetical protein
MGWLKKETAYERRMRELEEEADRIRKNMLTLQKAASRDVGGRGSPAAGQPPVYRSTAMPSPTMNAADDAESPESDEAFVAQDASAFESGFVGERTARNALAGSPPDKLAHYLASGSFGSSRSLSRERRLQRNKAIFMLIVALLGLLILYSWFK